MASVDYNKVNTVTDYYLGSLEDSIVTKKSATCSNNRVMTNVRIFEIHLYYI